jgi:hypothetical protein
MENLSDDIILIQILINKNESDSDVILNNLKVSFLMYLINTFIPFSIVFSKNFIIENSIVINADMHVICFIL